MTRTFQFATQTSDNTINPLFVKMKDRFFQNNRAVGDILRQRMESINIETEQQITPSEERDTAAEHRVTRANFLPKEKGASNSHAMRSFESTVFMNRQFRTSTLKTVPKKKTFPFRMVILASACVFVLMLLIYSGMQINRLNRELNSLNEQLAAKEVAAEKLQKEVEERIDLQEIEKEALYNLGMVRTNTVDHVPIDINDGDAVDIYGAKRNPDLLLKAFETSFGN